LADWRDERRRRRPVPDAGTRREPVHRVEARPVGGRGVRVLEGHPAWRALAGVGGFVLLVEALRRWPEGVDRSVAGSLVVGAALLWYAARGRMPAWFGRCAWARRSGRAARSPTSTSAPRAPTTVTAAARCRSAPGSTASSRTYPPAGRCSTSVAAWGSPSLVTCWSAAWAWSASTSRRR